MPRSKSRAIVRSSVRSARSRWATPGGPTVAAISRSLSDVAVRSPRFEPTTSWSGPTICAATNTTARATSGAASGSSSVTAAINQPEATAIIAGSAPRTTNPAHQATHWVGAARYRAAKNVHS